MATLVLSLAGQFAGGLVGGPIGATIGRALGALAGSALDATLFGEKAATPAPGADIRLTGSAEGGAIPRLYGWGRLAGNVFWATELERLTGETAGAKGGGAAEADDETIAASFAVAFCDGPVQRLGRIWADGQLLDTQGLNFRFYDGSDGQPADSLIEAKQGAAPAYRGLCYIVFERLPLTAFGNRLPSISAELCRVVGELEPAIRAVTVIPGASEFGYDPEPRVRIVSPGTTAAENTHAGRSVSDWTVSLDELQALCPNLERVALVVAWFGSDLRCADCTIRPKVEAAIRDVSGAEWSVAGLSRGAAQVVSSHAGGPAYGGTPSDAVVRAAIADLKARGLAVTLYPIVLMDLPAGNTLANPYTGASGQPAYPWRGRITCAPAPGRAGSPDGTAAAATQIDDFVDGTWGYRRFVTHYAQLAVAAGGVDAFVVGSELRGLSTVRGADGFPFVTALLDLAGEVAELLPEAALTYAADWSEYSGYQPEETPGDRYFHLDPLWASPAIAAVGIDNYMPLTDWRDGLDHIDALAFDSIYDLDTLRAGIGGGEGFDWYYADPAARIAGNRSPISDGAYGEPWVWRVKDIAGWWGNAHHERIGGVRATSPTAWVPGSKPVWFTELGCGAVDKGSNQPNSFADAKSAEDGRPYFSSGAPDGLMQRQLLRAHLRHWADPEANPAGMVEPGHIYLWTWDSRPYPAFPNDREAWADGANHATGHWLNGRLGGAASDELALAIAADHGAGLVEADARPPLVAGYRVDTAATARAALEPVLAATGLALGEGGTGLSARAARPRLAQIVAADELVADDGPLLARRRPDPGEAIGQLALAFVERDRDYLAATVTAALPEGGPLGGEATTLVLDLAAARRAAEHLLLERGLVRDTVELTLPEAWSGLETGDVLTLTGEGGGPFEITEIRDGAARRITARAVPPPLDVVVTADRPAPVSPGSGLRSIPALLAAHLPPDPARPGISRLLLAATARPWPGDVLVTDTLTGATLVRLGASAAMGEVLEGSAAGPTACWDRFGSLTVRLYAGHLAAAEDNVVLAGGNMLALETDSGDWEILGFAEAELIAPATYRLGRLLRGRGGSDYATGPASPGRRLVVLDERVRIVDLPPDWLGATPDLRAFAGPADLDGQLFGFVAGLGPLLPLAPGHLRAKREAGGDIGLSWVRRSRSDTGNWAGTDVALDNVPEAYRITIFDGDTPVRGFDTAVPEATYTASQQAADFGGLPETLVFEVAQLSPLYGPGHARRGEFHD